MNLFDVIGGVLGTLFGIYGIYFVAIIVGGLFHHAPVFPVCPPRKRLAALIAARNEQAVVPALVESLLKQNYPRELFDIYVLPNNCTDHTREAALQAGARVLDVEIPVSSKGEVLAYAFDRLLDAPEKYDAYCIFDADNLVHPDFFQSVNDALQDGAQIAQGYRDSKNPRSGWIAGSMSIFYWFMNGMYNRMRAALGMSAALNGTGFMVSADLIRRTGWNTFTLTEDLEFTAQMALADVKIAWMDNAIIYDEQPVHFGESMTQRRRWFGGNMQCMKRYLGKLLRHKTLQAFDIGVIFSGAIVQVGGILTGLCSAVGIALHFIAHAEYIPFLLLLMPLMLLLCILLIWAFALIILRAEHRGGMVQKRAVFLFPLFLLTWMLANLSCIVTGPPHWKQIRHGYTQKLDG